MHPAQFDDRSHLSYSPHASLLLLLYSPRGIFRRLKVIRSVRSLRRSDAPFLRKLHSSRGIRVIERPSNCRQRSRVVPGQMHTRNPLHTREWTQSSETSNETPCLRRDSAFPAWPSLASGRDRHCVAPKTDSLSFARTSCIPRRMIRLSADFKRQASNIGRTRTGSRRSLANGE